MTAIKGSADHKQHLNLSTHAYNVIYHDMFSFMHSDSLSGFVNAVFSRYYEYADASISLALARKEEEYRHILKRNTAIDKKNKAASLDEKCSSASGSGSEGDLILSSGSGCEGDLILSSGSGCEIDLILSALLENEKKMLLKKVKSYGTGCMMKIRLNNENFAFLYSDEQEDPNVFHFPEDRYYKNVGQYVKAVLEEYAAKSFFEREEIYFREMLQMIEHCAQTGTLLRLEFQNGVFDMKPYGIHPDQEQEYHFLAGISCPKGMPVSEGQITSVRISQILSVQTRSYRSGRLTNEQKKEIQHLIRTSGIQFLNQEPAEDIVVYMTKEGVRKYRKMLHLRPLLVKKEDYEEYSIYHFHCTQLQARFYLFRLGGDTYVLKPAALREALKERYQTATEMYQRDPEEFAEQFSSLSSS